MLLSIIIILSWLRLPAGIHFKKIESTFIILNKSPSLSPSQFLYLTTKGWKTEKYTR